MKQNQKKSKIIINGHYLKKKAVIEKINVNNVWIVLINILVKLLK